MTDITTRQRVAAWNVTFLDEDGNVFAGLFVGPNSTTTYRDALHEVLGSFVLYSGADSNGISSFSNYKAWSFWSQHAADSEGAAADPDLRDPLNSPSMGKPITPGA